MSLMRIQFAAPINKIEFRQAGGKSVADISICKKNRTKEGDEATFSWLRISLWSAPDWMTAKLVKGAFIAGSGEFTLRSYEKDGQKRQSAECNCQSFDIEIGGEAGATSEPAAAPANRRHIPVHVTVAAEDEPAF